MEGNGRGSLHESKHNSSRGPGLYQFRI